MEGQSTLGNWNIHQPILFINPIPNHLENEKDKFIISMCNLLEEFDFDKLQTRGRPCSDVIDILKCLLTMSYHGFSYRRVKCDLRKMKEQGIIKRVYPRSTLNYYLNNKNMIKILMELIKMSALFFKDNEDTMIVDSTWFGLRMYSGGYRKVYDKKSTSLQKVKKIHIACLKNSKVIAFAKATKGTEHDSLHFNQIVNEVINTGFNIRTLLADKGYSGKNNYKICRDLGITNVFIDFKSNQIIKRAKSDLWRERIRLYKEHPEIWKETYRFRVIVEGVFSVIKKKGINYIRSRNETAQFNEELLKILVYNFCIIGKYF